LPVENNDELPSSFGFVGKTLAVRAEYDGADELVARFELLAIDDTDSLLILPTIPAKRGAVRDTFAIRTKYGPVANIMIRSPKRLPINNDSRRKFFVANRLRGHNRPPCAVR
jgi:hypothetical protein